MTNMTCRQCGKELAVSSRGPKPTYCGDACRKAASRGVPGRAAAEPAVVVSEPTDVRGLAHRRSERDFGDGDPCPEDASHGHLYFMKPGTRQWCPHSAHQGNPFYAHDGVTPAPRAASDFVPPLTGGDVERRPALREAPDSIPAGASLQLGLALAPAT